VRQYFVSQTTGTLRNKAFLVTDEFSQVRLAAYFPPVEDAVGARFLFPRRINGVEVVPLDGHQVTFELTEAPGVTSSEGRGRGSRGRRDRDDEGIGEEKGGVMRATFPLKGMLVDGELIL
jgi:hypothetical protein